VAGHTYGASDGVFKNTPNGTSDMLAMAYRQDGEPLWAHPLQIGSSGNDSIRAMALDDHAIPGRPVCRHLYLAGRVGGNLFATPHSMDKDEADCNCDLSKKSTFSILSQRTKWLKQRDDLRRTVLIKDLSIGIDNPLAGSLGEVPDQTDWFMMKVNPDTGEILQAVQLPLSRDNSADAIVVRNGKVYVAVNSFTTSIYDSDGSTDLFVLCADDLSYRQVYTEHLYSRMGVHIQSMDVDSSGNVYAAGFQAANAEKYKTGSFLVRKYSASARDYVWETKLGEQSVVEPQISLTVGAVTSNIYGTSVSQNSMDGLSVGANLRKRAFVNV
jgi:hypothetical protein